MTRQILIEPQAIYALTAIEKPEFLDNFNGRDGVFIKGFLINDKRNKNGWRTSWELAKRLASDFINHPGTYLEIQGEPDHPDGKTYLQNMSNQELARVTNIVGTEIDEENKQINYIAEILSPELVGIDFKQMLQDGLIDFSSPGIWPEEFEIVGTMENGKPALDVSKARALHYSYINDPAYGKDVAKIIGTCEGDGIDCSRQLAAKLSAQTVDNTTPCNKNKPCKLSNTNELISQVEDPLAPLVQKPIILKKLKSMFCPNKIDELHAEFAASTDSNDCVASKLKIIMKDHPEWEKDQQLAVAFSFCQVQGRAELTKDLDEKVPIQIISI